ncbi:MAG: glycoside hydrolase family 30 protein [Gaiellaceae bacterium]
MERTETFRATRLRVVRSSRSGERLAEAGRIPLETAVSPEGESDVASVLVDPQHRFQLLEGFGGAFTQSAAHVFARLPRERQDELLTAYFCEHEGHGYRFCRTPIHSCDFSPSSYTYVEDGDEELASFSIDPDRRELIPMIEGAIAVGGEIRLLASPWSPPAWMKTSGSMLRGGKLKPEYRDLWARYFCRYIREYERAGIPIWGVSVQNEPQAVQTWESCIWTGEEERDFVRDHLGPALEREGLDQTAILIWDHNRDRMVDRAHAVLSDPEAARFVWGTAFHWYEGEQFENVRLVHDAFPEKKLLLSEACQEQGTHHGSWQLAERYASAILHDLSNWAVAWIDWNLVLDLSGGPNHAGNYCSAPAIADLEQGIVHYESSYAAIGHFARFIRPGAQRILCASSSGALEALAFQDEHGSTSVVVLNRSDNPVTFTVAVEGRAATLESPAHSILTLLTEA